MSDGYELHDGVLYACTAGCTCGNPTGPYGHEPNCGWEPLDSIENVLAAADGRDAAVRRAEEAERRKRAVDDLFALQPDTSIRTTWHDGVEYWEVPADEMRAVLQGVPQPAEGRAEKLLRGIFEAPATAE